MPCPTQCLERKEPKKRASHRNVSHLSIQRKEERCLYYVGEQERKSARARGERERWNEWRRRRCYERIGRHFLHGGFLEYQHFDSLVNPKQRNKIPLWNVLLQSRQRKCRPPTPSTFWLSACPSVSEQSLTTSCQIKVSHSHPFNNSQTPTMLAMSAMRTKVGNPIDPARMYVSALDTRKL